MQVARRHGAVQPDDRRAGGHAGGQRRLAGRAAGAAALEPAAGGADQVLGGAGGDGGRHVHGGAGLPKKGMGAARRGWGGGLSGRVSD